MNYLVMRYERKFSLTSNHKIENNGKSNFKYSNNHRAHKIKNRNSECVLCLVTQSCLTLCDPMDCSLLNSTVMEILQARILEWAAVPSYRG